MNAADARRRGPHIRATLDYLAGLGATDVQVVIRRHLRVFWTFAGRPMAISLAVRPQDRDDCAHIAQQLVRRRFREAGVVVRARP